MDQSNEIDTYMIYLTPTRREFNGHTLHQIIQQDDTPYSSRGELGGWVEYRNQIDHSSWITPNVILLGDAKVGPGVMLDAVDPDTYVEDFTIEESQTLTRSISPKVPVNPVQQPVSFQLDVDVHQTPAFDTKEPVEEHIPEPEELTDTQPIEPNLYEEPLRPEPKPLEYDGYTYDPLKHMKSPSLLRDIWSFLKRFAIEPVFGLWILRRKHLPKSILYIIINIIEIVGLIDVIKRLLWLLVQSL